MAFDLEVKAAALDAVNMVVGPEGTRGAGVGRPGSVASRILILEEPDEYMVPYTQAPHVLRDLAHGCEVDHHSLRCCCSRRWWFPW